MSETVISLENLGKMYRIGANRKTEGLRHALEDRVKRLGRRLTGKPESKPLFNDFWALKEVSFEVKRGDCVGVIGRNGAGKSTLLKVLSRITDPTTGKVRMWGRVGSLLEVGTGFHQELSGRENIYLNGAILGMSRAEVTRKFDEIVAFSEVEKFLDTPVKYYSSGMYTRLAFSVAAHLEPDILIVDEVLAVGDAAFQKKCLGKMGEVTSEGRTVIFVSHQMQSVTRLCTRALLLETGRVKAAGPVEKVVQAYLSGDGISPAHRVWPPDCRPGNHVTRLKSVRVCDENGATAHAVDIRRPVGLEMEYEVFEAGHQLIPNLHLYNADGVCVFISGDAGEYHRSPKPPGRYRSSVRLPGNFLAEGTLAVHAAISTIEPSVVVHFWEMDAVAFEVVDTVDGSSTRGSYAGPYPGVVRPLLDWHTESILMGAEE